MIEDAQITPPVKDDNETYENAINAIDFLGDVANEGVFVIMGLGAGYFVKEVVEQINTGHSMIVYEPSAGVLKNAMHELDLTKMFACERIYIALGDVKDYWFVHHCHMRTVNGRLWVIKHKNFHNGDGELCDEFYKRFQEEKRIADINIGTQIGLGKTFMNCILKNIPEIIKNNGVVSLKDIAVNEPVLVVASGPSLDNSIDDLKKLADDIFIIACDTALPFLLLHDIVPDVVTGIDPLTDNNALFRDPRCKDIPLVCMAQYTPSVVKAYPGPIYFSSMPGNQVFQWLQWYWDNKGAVECFGGSVSHFAFGLAEYMGAKTIGLMGHDYSFKSKWYCGDTSEMLHKEMGKEVPDETKDAISQTNINGDPVFTRPTLLSFKTAVENKIKVFDGKVYNLSREGLPVEGTYYSSVDDFINKYCNDKPVIEHVSTSNGYQIDDLIKAVHLGKYVFKTIKKYSLKIIGLIHEARKLKDSGDKKGCRKILRKIEKMRHFTTHPLLEIMSGYHTILEIYLQRHDVKDIDNIKDEWEKRDAQMFRGLNYYGELNEAVGLFVVELDDLNKELKKIRRRDVLSGSK
jgi:hypothetical protein